MFELLIKVCVGVAFCHYTAPQLAYESLSLCQLQAGLIAGLKAGRHRPGEDVEITFRCAQEGDDRQHSVNWFEVSLLAEPR